MCKEADEPESTHQSKQLQQVIPENLPLAAPPPTPPDNAIFPPQHKFIAPNSQTPGTMEAFDDIPLSDINENRKAR